jgi:uncharacterized protein YbcI
VQTGAVWQSLVRWACPEEAIGRQVVAFMSGLDVDRDVACEVFTLELQ